MNLKGRGRRSCPFILRYEDRLEILLSLVQVGTHLLGYHSPLPTLFHTPSLTSARLFAGSFNEARQRRLLESAADLPVALSATLFCDSYLPLNKISGQENRQAELKS